MAETKDTTVAVIVERDYWDANAERVAAGTEITVSVDDAMRGVESGAFRRAAKDAK